MKFGNFLKIYLELVFWIFFFFKIRTDLCSVNAFSRPGVLFFYFLCWNNAESLEKTSIDFSNKTFPIETGIVNVFHYIWGIWFIHKNT